MKRRGGSSVRVNVFIADASHLVCELMAKALTDSQRIAVVGLATDSSGVRKGLAENSADVALISANLGDGRNTGFQVVRERSEERRVGKEGGSGRGERCEEDERR